MLTPEAAWRAIAERLEPRPARRLPRRRTLGLTLAEDLVATVDIPPADVSAMDGYACAGEVTPGRPVPVVGTVAAGPPRRSSSSPAPPARS